MMTVDKEENTLAYDMFDLLDNKSTIETLSTLFNKKCIDTFLSHFSQPIDVKDQATGETRQLTEENVKKCIFMTFKSAALKDSGALNYNLHILTAMADKAGVRNELMEEVTNNIQNAAASVPRQALH